MEPQPDWKQLTADELVAELDKRENELPRGYENVDLMLLTLVKKGKAKAWLCPDGKIRYQYGGEQK